MSKLHLSRALDRLQRIAKRLLRMPRAMKAGIREGAQNCLYLERFDSSSVVIDVGCANDADLSLLMINRFGVKSYGVDPTQKHFKPLQTLAKETGERFVHVPLAVSDISGELTFHESLKNVSGSLFVEHVNIQNDQTRSYSVEAVTLDDLLKKLNLSCADFLKLDLEGIEYKLLAKISKTTLEKFGQIFVEFHHHCLPQYSQVETHTLVERIKSFGYQAFSFDDHNFLFFRT